MLLPTGIRRPPGRSPDVLQAASQASASGGRGERVTGQPQVDVVEGRLAGADRPGKAELVDGGDRLARAVLVQRHRHARADRECVFTGDATFAQGGKRAIVDLGSPVGVDNVDGYRLMVQSFRWK